MKPDQLRRIQLDKIDIGERFRKDLGNIDDLAESIKDKGVIQPITVRPLPQGRFGLLAGGRRFAAGQKAGIREIPALVRETEGEIDEREIELIENAFRLDMHWSERDKLVARIDQLCREKNIEWSGRKTAILMGKSAMSVSRSLQLARAMEIIPDLAKQDTQQQAEKLLKALEEQQIVAELRTRQQDSINTRAIDKGLRHMLELAEHNYRVGDVFEGLLDFMDNGVVHLIECDPPYGIDLNEQKRGHEEATSSVRTYNEIDRSEYPAWLSKLARELYRVAGRNCWCLFWYGPTWHTEVLDALEGAGWTVDDIPAIWNKRHGQTMQPAYNLARAYEPFFVARKGQPAIIKQGRANVFDFAPVAGQKKYHPTERPLDLMQEVLETFAAPRSVVMVPFAGSGVTLRAAYLAGMSAVGWDLNGEYKDRFMLAVEQDTKNLNKETENDNG